MKLYIVMALKESLEVEDGVFPVKIEIGAPEGVAGYLLAFSDEARAREYAGDKFRIMEAETP